MAQHHSCACFHGQLSPIPVHGVKDRLEGTIQADGNKSALAEEFVPASPRNAASIMPTATARAWGDLLEGMRRWELWSTLGWHDIRRRYRRSSLGPFWLTLSMAAMVAGIGFLYAGLFGQAVPDYLPYLSLGLILWNLIASFLNEGCTCLTSASGPIKQVKAPISVYIYRSAWTNILVFLHNLAIIPVVFLIFRVEVGLVALWAIPGLVLLCLACIGMSVVLAILSARFRDVPPIVAMIVQFAFFFTPVIWQVQQLPGRSILVELNPFYYLMEVVRAPLLGSMPSLQLWAGSVVIVIASWIMAFAFFMRYRQRVSYWV